MLRKINKIIKKNFLLLIRSKGSSLIVILGPLLLILLVGLAFSHSKPYSIDVGVYTKTPNDLTTDVLKKLNEEQFKVVEYTNSKECVESVKKGDVDICMFFPDNFIIREKQRNTITFNVDYSNINLVYAVLEVITQKVNEESKEISVDLTEDLLTVLENTKNEVNKDLEAVVQLNKQDEKISEKSDSIKARLKELNLEFNKDNFKLNELTLKIDAIKKIGLETILLGKTAFVDIENKMDEMNLTEEKQEPIRNLIDKTSNDMDNLQENLEKMYDSTNMSSIGRLISNINTNLEQLQIQFAKASSARSQTIEELNNIDIIISDSLTKLNNVQSSMETIKDTIENIKVKSAVDIVSPITTKIIPVTAEKTHFNLLFPTLVVLISMITGILLGSTLVIVEKKSKSFFRNNVTPTSDIIFHLGTYFTGLIVLVVQLIIFLLISTFLFKINIWQSLSMNIIILLGILSLFILLGMLIGVIFRSEETTTLAAITLASIMLFFSSTVLPLESMPYNFMKVSAYNPFVISVELLKQSMLFNLGFENLSSRLMILLGYIIAAFIIVVKTQDLLKHKAFYHIHKKSKELKIFSMYKEFTKKKEKEWHKTRLKNLEEIEKRKLDEKKIKLEAINFSKEKEEKIKETKTDKVLDEVEEHNKEIKNKIEWLEGQLKQI